MTHGSLFSGVGGFDLAAKWMGWENKFHCEWNPFGQEVLKYYHPNAISYNDITTTDFSIWRGKIDILTGGFPCQPFSTAGKRKGTGDSRYLWPEMLRVIREVRPQWVVGENVYGLVNWDGGLVFDTVCLDLENEGFKVIPVVLPACGVNAPHQRYRIWFVAYCESGGNRGELRRMEESNGEIGQPGQPEECRQNDTQSGDIGSQWTFFNTNHQGGGDGFGQIQGENGEIPQRNHHAESCDSGQRSLKDPYLYGWGSNLRKENANLMELWDASSGNHESISADHGEVITDPRLFGQEESELLSMGLEQLRQSGDVTDPIDKGLQGSKVFGVPRGGWAESHQLSSGCFCPTWENFPTQSPLCSRNDGLPAGLSGITISKHRQESIKAYGNAIVPQLAYQIFKTIAHVQTTSGY